MSLTTDRKQHAASRPPQSWTLSPQAVRTSIYKMFELARRSGAHGTWELDPYSDTLMMSPSFKKLLDFAPYELADSRDTLRSLIHEEDREMVTEQIHRCIDDDEVVISTRFRIANRHGAWRTLMAWGQALPSLSGDSVRVVGFICDITTQRQLAEAISRSEIYRQILGETGVALARSANVCDQLEAIAKLITVPPLADWCLVQLEPKWLADLPQDVQPPCPVGVVHHQDVKVREALSEALVPMAGEGNLDALWTQAMPTRTGLGTGWFGRADPRALAQANRANPKLRYLRKAGLHALLQVPLQMEGRHIGNITLGRGEGDYGRDDVAAVQLVADRAALALHHAKLCAKHIARPRDLDENLAVVAHDLRSPLTAIVLRCERSQIKLRREPSKGEEIARSLAQDVERYAVRMQGLIHSVLELAKMRGGLFVIESKSIDATTLLENLRWIITPIAQSQGIKLEWDVDADLGQVAADIERINQVFSNLVDNALKFSRWGQSIHLQVRSCADYVQFSVTDEGPGISEANLVHLFERFWQDKKTAHQGTGLGLYIARGIIRAHGGDISVRSRTQAPSGSTFQFTLPRAAPKA